MSTVAGRDEVARHQGLLVPAGTVDVRPLVVVASSGGCALAAAGLVAALGRLDERLVWWLAAAVAAAAVLIVGGVWLVGRVEERRYRHNRVLGTVEGWVAR